MPEVTEEFRRNKTNLEIKRALRADGWHVPEIDGIKFLDGVRKLFPPNPDLPALHEEIIGSVTRHNPRFLDEHPLFSEPLTKQRIRELYGKRTDLIAIEGSPKKVFEGVTHSYQVWLKSIKFFMIDHPHPKELTYTIEKAEEILEGKWEPT
jgi:hypothetical protein